MKKKYIDNIIDINNRDDNLIIFIYILFLLFLSLSFFFPLFSLRRH
jgi:hypothetical protein